MRLLLSSASENSAFKKAATALVSQKNKHGLLALCGEYGIDGENATRVAALADMYGDAKSVLERLLPICEAVGALPEYKELCTLCTLVGKNEFRDKVKVDFSVVNDMNYYNGIVFVGFLDGISEGVLSGGEYGKLASRMGKKAGAVGFAIYLDLIEDCFSPTAEYDVDVLIVYNEFTDAEKLITLKEKIVSEGRSVSTQCSVPKKLRYKEMIKI